MFIADLPDGISQAPLMVLALKSEDASLLAKGRRVLGICRLASVDKDSESRIDVDPTDGASLYLQDFDGVTEPIDHGPAEIGILEPPAHGVLSPRYGDEAVRRRPFLANRYIYVSNNGYTGEDRFTMETVIRGTKVEIRYQVVITAEANAYYLCPKGHWKISANGAAHAARWAAQPDD